jgi:hypothetical protein
MLLSVTGDRRCREREAAGSMADGLRSADRRSTAEALGPQR